MNVLEAMAEVKGRTNENRGVGCFAIVMMDGREYSVVDQDSNLVERFEYADPGDTQSVFLAERVHARDVKGDVKHIDVSCDETGGLYI